MNLKSKLIYNNKGRQLLFRGNKNNQIKTIKKNKNGTRRNKKVEVLDASQLEKLQAFEKFMKAAREILGGLQINYEVQK